MTPQFLALVWGPCLLFGLIFAISFWREPRRLVNGVWFNISLVSGLVGLAASIFATENILLIAVCGTLFIIAVLLVALGFALHLVWLIWNAIVVWRRESHSLGNMLTLLIAIGLLLLEIGASIGTQFLPGWLYAMLAAFFSLSIGYGLLTLYNYLTCLVLYNLRPLRKNRDYLIVLGAGLLNGDQVSPLLAARINAAIKFQRKQKRPGTIVFSGGQGGDETVPEAVAMQRYAIKQGVPVEQTLLEDRSTTTLENMQFSKQVIAQVSQQEKPRVAFFTNNYHLFRAGLYAKQAGLAANGGGARTSFYFLPNAVIREFVAILLMNKKRHVIIFAMIVLLSLLTGIGALLR